MRIATILVALAVLACAPAVHAATATVVDPGSDLGTTDVQRLDVTWDGAVLTVALTYADEPISFAFGLRISASLDPRRARTCASWDEDSFAIRAGETSARLTAPFLSDAIVAPRAWDGAVARYAFVSPALTAALTGPRAHDPFTCASGEADADALFGAFAGKLLKLTPALMRQALVTELTKRFGSRFTHASRPWLRCPKQTIVPETETTWSSASCEFEFRQRGSAFRGGSFTTVLRSGTLTTDEIHSSTYTKGLRACRIVRNLTKPNPRVLDRVLRASGYVGCHDGGSSMVRQLDRFRSGVHQVAPRGTSGSGFEERARFRCVLRRSGERTVAVCRNALGDGFHYAYTLRRPAPKPVHRTPPPAPRAQCDPSYSGACLNPNASDYDCAGGSGDGPLYTGQVQVVGDDHFGLDRDGDGVGCE